MLTFTLVGGYFDHAGWFFGNCGKNGGLPHTSWLQSSALPPLSYIGAHSKSMIYIEQSTTPIANSSS